MGVGPIPASKVKQYGRDEIGLYDDDALERFCTIIRRMDDDYVSAANSSSKTKGKRSRGAGGADENAAVEIPVDDTQGVRQIFRNIKARKESAAKQKLAGKP